MLDVRNANHCYTFDLMALTIGDILLRYALSIGDLILCKRGLDGHNSYLKFLFGFRKRKLCIF